MEMDAHIVRKLKGSETISLILTPIHFLIKWDYAMGGAARGGALPRFEQSR